MVASVGLENGSVSTARSGFFGLLGQIYILVTLNATLLKFNVLIEFYTLGVSCNFARNHKPCYAAVQSD